MPEAVIVATTRSPIGRAFKGSLKDVRPDDLAATIVQAALDQVPELDPSDIDDLMLGCGLPGGEQGFNMGRVVSVLLGLDHLPGTTITRYCASSLQTTRMAMHAIKAGEGDVFISAGVETVSRFTKGSSDSLPDTQNTVFADAKTRGAADAENGADSWSDPRDLGELPDAYIDMGQTAENLALLKGVTRTEMDEFAARSQHLTGKATADGFWEREITPITLPDGTVVSTDDSPRPGTTLEALAALKPAFRPGGRVTAGNACPLNDGAAALIVMSDTKARDLGLTPLARIISTGVTGLSPEIMGYGPVAASQQALARAGMSVKDIDLVEINEAFAAQVIPSYRDLAIDLDKLNVHGGALAVGHPFGMSGARITGTLINGLRSTDRTLGLETMCVGATGTAGIVKSTVRVAGGPVPTLLAAVPGVAAAPEDTSEGQPTCANSPGCSGTVVCPSDVSCPSPAGGHDRELHLRGSAALVREERRRRRPGAPFAVLTTRKLRRLMPVLASWPPIWPLRPVAGIERGHGFLGVRHGAAGQHEGQARGGDGHALLPARILRRTTRRLAFTTFGPPAWSSCRRQLSVLPGQPGHRPGGARPAQRSLPAAPVAPPPPRAVPAGPGPGRPDRRGGMHGPVTRDGEAWPATPVKAQAGEP